MGQLIFLFDITTAFLFILYKGILRNKDHRNNDQSNKNSEKKKPQKQQHYYMIRTRTIGKTWNSRNEFGECRFVSGYFT